MVRFGHLEIASSPKWGVCIASDLDQTGVMSANGVKWVSGTVARRRGHVLYELAVYGKKETHHVNHIRRRNPNICDRPEDISELPPNILLFELPTNMAESNPEENTAQENHILDTRHSGRTPAPIRHPT
ncbi:hypothetical protein P879_01768 [Paragonimus westermani]|uniref:Uncharacterized protein n=1 Tax=Paragonimus westermani TaxID=34504 RepID=A0A8T0DFA9_9TREM|nr:hypothetical protein P879_01768 [Paragonimus westermani]